jgi:hypothetical protein
MTATCCVLDGGRGGVLRRPEWHASLRKISRPVSAMAGAIRGSVIAKGHPSIFQMNRLNRSSSYGLTSLMIDALDDVPFWPNVRKPITNTKLNAKLFAGERTKS